MQAGAGNMESFGTTRLAALPPNHINSVANPKSQYRKSFSIEEVLSSQMVAYR